MLRQLTVQVDPLEQVVWQVPPTLLQSKPHLQLLLAQVSRLPDHVSVQQPELQLAQVLPQPRSGTTI